MNNALTYLTRDCPRACNYCALREAKGVGKNLTQKEWAKAFEIIKRMKVEFNLILGNETWLLGSRLINIIKAHKPISYALYTTCPPTLFNTYKWVFYGDGVIDNLSCGLDFPMKCKENVNDDSFKKSEDAWKGFQWIKKHYPEYDTQGTVTVHKGNYIYLPQLIKECTDLGVFIGINFIHWNSDGNFDFFPNKGDIQELLFTKEDHVPLRRVLDKVLENPGLLQNPQYISNTIPIETMVNMGWHCKGDPYGGPTIDSDGSLRVCGYRKGKYTSQFSIFDLPDKKEEWKLAVEKDASECPGCYWSYPWMTQYWKEKNPELGNKVFSSHAGEHIPKEKWSKRK